MNGQVRYSHRVDKAGPGGARAKRIWCGTGRVVPAKCLRANAKAGRMLDAAGPYNLRRYKIYSTLMVMTSDCTGGSCGMWLRSPNTACSVCLPGGNSSVASVWALPKCLC